MDKLIQEKEVGLEYVYNSHQTGMFYAKLPNSVCVDKKNKNNYKGTEQTKDKSRVTEMIATAADGSWLLFAIIVKQKNGLLSASQA